MAKMRDRFGRFVKRARGAGRRAAGGARRVAVAARRAGGAIVRRSRGFRSARAGKTYHMGAVPRLTWFLWGADAIADPLIGGGKMSDSRPSAWQTWKNGQLWGYHPKDITSAYEAFKDRLSLNLSGYSTKDGVFYDMGDPKVLRTWKAAVAPISATAVDFGIAYVAGSAGKKTPKLGPLGHVVGYRE